MRRLLVAVGLLGLGAVGCANSTKLERESRLHYMRADAAGSVRDYNRAAAEKSEAERLHGKAVKKAYKEGNSPSVVIPAAPEEVPAPPANP
ncbi:MAG TPA: hypothetical protein VFF06_01295 [Polyangia bacterium]|nr:hypothetical protein [Polyangia bacterium]